MNQANHLFVIGHPPAKEFLDYALQNGMEGYSADNQALYQEWLTANRYVQNLERLPDELCWADAIDVRPLDPCLESTCQLLMGCPSYQHHFGLLPTMVALVELDHLIIRQKFINLDYIRDLKAQISPDPTPEELFALCLPMERTNARIAFRPVSNDTYIFVSPSLDLRFLGPLGLNQQQVKGSYKGVEIGAMLGLVIGYSSNFVHAVQRGNRMVLCDGYHRAYALLERGIRYAPCIVQVLQSLDDLAIAVSADYVTLCGQYFEMGRPPLMKDFFDVALARPITTMRQQHQIKITFTVETMDVPVV